MRSVVLRSCPACGARLLGAAGVSWMPCTACASAWDAFAEPPERIPTFRPASSRGVAGPRLPFYVFGVGTRAGETRVFVPAYRAPGERSDADLGARLTVERYAAEFAEAPLGAAVARGPREAAALLASRRPKSSGGDAAWMALVSLSCRLERDALVEPVTGWRLPLAELFPGPILAGAPPPAAS